MLKKSLIALIVSITVFNGCTKKYKPPHYKAKGAYLGKPYIIRGKIYYPFTKVKDFKQIGIASWYGKEEHGKLTASGERFNMYDMTAAHKLLPLGSIVLVKNLENGREVVVRINDRGPFVSGRIIDLSYSAAEKIGIVGKGTARVKITLLSQNRDFYEVNNKKLNLEKGNFSIQIGSFKHYSNAVKLAQKTHNSKIVIAHVNGDKFYRVWITGFKSLSTAKYFLNRLKEKYSGAFIIRE